MNLKRFQFQIQRYASGQRCVSLLTQSGEPYMTLSTNLQDSSQEGEHIFIKNGEEAQEIAQKMCSMGLLIWKETQARSGWNTYTLYELTPKLFELAIQD